MKLNLDAPIVPGVGAAGISLGTSIEALLQTNPGVFTAEPVLLAHRIFGNRYSSPCVNLVAPDATGAVTAIMVHGQYRGLLLNQIGLSSTVSDIESIIGPCGEDDEDNLIIIGVPGLRFEIAGTFADPNWKKRPITWLLVEIPSKRLSPKEARLRLRDLIQDFIAGVDRSVEQIDRLRTVLDEPSLDTAIKEELDYHIKKYSPVTGKPHRIGEEELANVLLYVWAVYLMETE